MKTLKDIKHLKFKTNISCIYNFTAEFTFKSVFTLKLQITFKGLNFKFLKYIFVNGEHL